MARANQFNHALNDLFKRRTVWLRSILEQPKRGAPTKLTKFHIKNYILKLQRLASDSLSHDLAKDEFENGVRQRKSWHLTKSKGWGYRQKKQSFNTWFNDHISGKNCIYVCWNKRDCIYVGKTTKGPRRISGHFEKIWFNKVTRIDVYESRGRRYLPALECIAVHRFQPKENRSKAETKKWTRKCPLCDIHKNIEHELKAIFRLR